MRARMLGHLASMPVTSGMAVEVKTYFFYK